MHLPQLGLCIFEYNNGWLFYQLMFQTSKWYPSCYVAKTGHGWSSWPRQEGKERRWRGHANLWGSSCWSWWWGLGRWRTHGRRTSTSTWGCSLTRGQTCCRSRARWRERAWNGATPHASDLNINYLAAQFNGRLLARRSEPLGGRDWAARSPDLNPLDYGINQRLALLGAWLNNYTGIWGILKSRVYSQARPRTMLQLRTRVDQEVARLGADRAMLR